MHESAMHGGSLRICIATERRYLSQAQPAGLERALVGQGHRVTLLVVDDVHLDLDDPGFVDRFDVVVGRGRSPALLCLLSWSEQRGVRTVNTAAAISRVLHKDVMGAVMAAAGLPVPRTWLMPLANIGELSELMFPLVLKPATGDNGRDVHLLHSADAVAGLTWPESHALLQRFVRSDGDDLKLYVAGSAVWAVRKRSQLCPVDVTQLPRLVPVTPALAEIARRCAELFELELFGVDCLLTDNGPVVIEVNDFPNYTAVRAGSAVLASYVTRQVKGRNNHAHGRHHVPSPAVAAQPDRARSVATAS